MRLGAGTAVKKKRAAKAAPKKLQVPRTIWVGWCHTCGAWLDETDGANHAIALVLDEHPEHFDTDHPWRSLEQGERECYVEIIPFRADRKRARKVQLPRAAVEAVKARRHFTGVKIKFTP